MQSQPKRVNIPPNPIHRRQVFWQIWFPLAAVALLILTAAVLAAVFSANGQINSSQLASVSIIWMILPMIVAGIIFLTFTAGMIFLLARALRILPVYTHLILIYANIIHLRVTGLLDRLAMPIIQSRGAAAGCKSIFKRFRRA